MMYTACLHSMLCRKGQASFGNSSASRECSSTALATHRRRAFCAHLLSRRCHLIQSPSQYFSPQKSRFVTPAMHLLYA
ncbi:hypothetical protein ARMGADRAFT_545184 [Armillaria gallica]|uniref:Uncharacterized protein n=1 Tax=Armillaria gallica TaxID=47427 RepID=A0A2H3CVI3_ARMGA|nr:hypothetical protein ARMGADRAFT_545184 [Armillaria gallica]